MTQNQIRHVSIQWLRDPALETANPDECEAFALRILNKHIEDWNREGYFVTFPAAAAEFTMQISFCCTPAEVKTPQRLILCTLCAAEDIRALDPQHREGFVNMRRDREFKKMEAAHLRVDSHLLLPNGCMFAIVTEA